jgi:hypothetical protein
VREERKERDLSSDIRKVYRMKVEEIFGANTIKQIYIMIKQKCQSVFLFC